jgi:hypothetical protein
MTTVAGYPESAARRGIGGFAVRHPVLCAWTAISLFLVTCRFMGYSPLADLDDALKLIEIRDFLQSGAWFDRTIPGILQPEPFISHWVRLTDLPYAAVAAPLVPLIGREAALAVASFAIPLVLLLLALYFYRRVIGEMESERPAQLFLIALIPAIPAFFEFAPDRVDYHNLELVFLFASLWLTMDRRLTAAAVNGAVVSLAFGIGLEFALFYAAVMAAYAVDFLMRRPEADRRLTLFGAALAATGLFTFLIIVPPGQYGVVYCDSYSTPHLFVLVCAGLSFAAAGYLSPRTESLLLRTAMLAIPACLSVAGLVYLFPECQGGPFSALSDYLMTNWVGHIPQDRSMLARPDIVLTPTFLGTSMTLASAAAIVVIGLQAPRKRNLFIFAAFTLLALVQGYLLIRYFRYLGFFAGLGLILTLAAMLPRTRQAGALLSGTMTAHLPSLYKLLLPGVLLVTVTIGSFFVRSVPENVPASGADFAGNCKPGDGPALQWPAGASILAPPILGIQILAAKPDLGATVVATPHHRAWHGVERAFRFLDPRTQNPREYLDQSKATHVAVCAWRGAPLLAEEKSYPLTAALLEGHPPQWLIECPLPASSRIRVYRYPAAGGVANACPTAASIPAG